MAQSNGAASLVALFGTVALWATASPAVAQDRSFHIPSETASRALTAFSQQSGEPVLAAAADLEGVRTHAVDGVMPAGLALARMIEGTGLVIKVVAGPVSGNAIVIGRAPPVVAAAAARAPAREVTPPVVQDPTLVVVSGFRRSLQNASYEKQTSINFTESVFAEDLGKFPDLNLAESLQRVPGVQLTRDPLTGEGIQVAIRALDPSFTNVLINSDRIEVASDGGLDGGSVDRETDLNLFPSELFSRIVVSKTPQADQLEGGIAGTVNLSNLRPFDISGDHTSGAFSDGYGQSSRQWSPRGSFITSKTWEHWGVLFGAAGEITDFETDGFETLGWTHANLNCAGCVSSPGNNFTFASSVPQNAGNGLTPGTPVDLAALNPDVSLGQLADALFPRLARHVLVAGRRSRVTSVASLQYRPSDDLQFVVDTTWGRAWRAYQRDDADWYVRNSAPTTTGGMVPIGVTLDANDILTSGTFANSAFLDQTTSRVENLDYIGFQPSMNWRLNARLRVDVELSLTRSQFIRDSTSYIFDTPFNSGLTVHYQGNGSGMPSIQSSMNLNDPSLGWTLDRVNIQNMRRVTDTWGAHANATYQLAPDYTVKVGYAVDRVTRTIFAWDNTDAYLASFSSYIPATAIAGYLVANTDTHYLSLVSSGGGFRNFVVANIPAIMAASHYSYFNATAPVSTTATVQGTPTGSIDETYDGAYVQFDGRADFLGRPLRVDAGIRVVNTTQDISGPVMVNNLLTYPASGRFYGSSLPSFNAVWQVWERFNLRVAFSKTMSRPNPMNMLPGISFTDPSAQTATEGNPNLKPYYSDNADIGLEYYTGRIGYISLALFDKRITGFTYASERTERFADLGINFNSLTISQQQAIIEGGGPDNAVVSVATQQNASSLLTLRGMELTWVQPLDLLHKGLGLTANYTRLDPDYSGATNLATGIAPYSYNITAYYENASFSTHMSYVYQAQRETANAPQNGLPLALYAAGRGQIDLSAAWSPRWIGRGKITLDATNLGNAPFVVFFGDKSAPYSIYNPGYRIMLGWRGQF